MPGLLLGVMVTAADVGDRIAAQVLLEQVAGPVRAWAKTATLTKSAVAYNADFVLNLDDEARVQHGGGLRPRRLRLDRTPRPRQGRPHTADNRGRRPLADLQHRCGRAFGPRPDLIA
ncbi:hypothetical protein [Streptomyces sp. NPDC000994]